MDYLAFGFSDGVGSRSSLSLQNGEQPIERRTSRLWINKLTGRVDDEPASLPARPNRLTPTRSFPQVAVGLEDGRRTTQSPPRRLSTVVSDPSGGSGQALEGDLRDRILACEEALDAVQTRLASIEAQVRLAGVDDELEDVSDEAPSPAKSLFSRTLPKTSPLSTPGTSQEAHPPTPPLTPPLTPPEGTQTKPQVLVGRWLPAYGEEAPL